MRLSIIIPVYNVEEYIEKCVNSLQQQDIPKNEYELIIINDGSPDNSREIVLRLMKQFNNIVFINQENKGVSRARNSGIDKAKGKYLLFIDPDDYVVPDTLGKILKTADENRAQITLLGYTFLNADNSVRHEILFSDFKHKIYSGTEAFELSKGNGRIDPDRSVALLFDREFMNRNSIRYVPDVPYLEDGELLARIFCLAKNCIFEGNPFYMRTTREGSATNSRLFYSDKAINGFIKAACNLKEFSENQQLSDEQRNFMNQPIAKFTLLAIQACAKPSNWKKSFYVRSSLISKGFQKLSLDGVCTPFIFYGRLYNMSFYLFLVAFGLANFKTSILLKISKPAINYAL